MQRNSDSTNGDQGDYLQLGLDMREHGTLTDAVRNPLYSALLLPATEREWSYFTWAKIVSLVFGALTIWATYEVGNRLFDRTAGILAAFLVGINTYLKIFSTFAYAESLLTLLILLSWFMMVRALQEPRQTRYWVISGLLIGLAYLTKGTGQLIAACFVLSAIVLHSSRIWLKREVWLFVLSYMVVASPLWIYNWRVYGSPTFNLAITNQMWMDAWEENYVANPSTLPTWQTYLQTHSLAEIWDRLEFGLLSMRYFFPKVLWPTRSLAFDTFFLSGGLDILLASLLTGIAVSGRFIWPAIQRHRESVLLSTLCFIIFFILFGWYLPIVPDPIRFILPLMPPLLILVSAGMNGLYREVFFDLTAPSWRRWLGKVIGVGLLLWVGRWFIATGLTQLESSRQENPFTLDAQFNTVLEAPLLWVRAGHSKTRPITVLSRASYSTPYWRHSDQLHFVYLPIDVETVEAFEAYLDQHNVTYLVLDSKAHNAQQIATAETLDLQVVSDSPLKIENFFAAWALGYPGPQPSWETSTFRRLSAPPAITKAEVLFGDSIGMFGYELRLEDFKPGGKLTVTLYWESVQPVSENYTVFVQLLGPDYQLYGQKDKQPLAGLWPTSDWRPGSKITDKFELEVNDSAPPGQYIVLVGFYDLNTGQRLPVVAPEKQVSDNAIWLQTIEINIK